MTLIDPHLDVDQVSAAVDGDRDPAVAAHLLVCLSCREQVDAWRRVLRSLGEVPVLPAELLDRMVERSLDGSERPANPAVRSLDDVVWSRPARRAPTRRRLRLAERRSGLAGVAALLVVAMLMTGAVVGLRHDRTGGSSRSAAPSLAPAVSGTPAASTAGGKATVSTGSAAATHATRNPAPGPRTAFAGTAELTAELHRLAPKLRPTTPPATAPCLRQATTVATDDPAVEGRAVWFDEAIELGGTAGRVFVFQGVHDLVAVVVRADTCSLLATLLF